MMDAVILDRFGGPEVLRRGQIVRPSFRADQMLVRVAACGICGHDLLNRSGHFGATRLPTVLGHEIAGTVERAGELVANFKPGDRVALLQRQPCGLCRSCGSGRENLCRSGAGFYGEEITGGYAEYVVACDRNAVLLPPGIPFHVGAVLSCAVGTGFHALLRARLHPGEAVVITAASGGVGINTVQIAKLMGLTSFAITTSAAKKDELRKAGADEVIVTSDGTFHDRVRAATGGEGAAAVIEIAGAPTFASSIRSVRAGGRVVLVGNVAPGRVAFNPAVSILKEIEFIGSGHAVLSDLREVINLVENQRLAPPIAATLPLTEAASAHRMLERRSAIGRYVLTHA